MRHSLSKTSLLHQPGLAVLAFNRPSTGLLASMHCCCGLPELPFGCFPHCLRTWLPPTSSDTAAAAAAAAATAAAAAACAMLCNTAQLSLLLVPLTMLMPDTNTRGKRWSLTTRITSPCLPLSLPVIIWWCVAHTSTNKHIHISTEAIMYDLRTQVERW